MKTFILIVTTLLLFACKSARNSPPPPPSERHFRHYNQECRHNGKLKKDDRRNIYPFSLAAKINVISFANRDDEAPPDFDDSTVVHKVLPQLPHFSQSTPILNDTIATAYTIDNIQLTENQIDQLTDVLYNYNFSKKTTLFSVKELGCYYPRHAIVFLDESSKVITFIEICLECRHIETDLPPESLGVFCDGKYDLLKAFFVGVGIKYFKA